MRPEGVGFGHGILQDWRCGITKPNNYTHNDLFIATPSDPWHGGFLHLDNNNGWTGPLARYSTLCDEFVSIDYLIDMSGICGMFPLINKRNSLVPSRHITHVCWFSAAEESPE